MWTIALVAPLLALGCTELGSPTLNTEQIAPISLSLVSGDGQVGIAGETLSDPLVIRAEVNGSPLAGEVVTWAIVEGGGSLYAGVSQTDSDGYAREWWTLGDPGPQVVEVRAVDPTTGEKRLYGKFEAEAKEPDDSAEDEKDTNEDGEGEDEEPSGDDEEEPRSAPSLVAHYPLSDGSGTAAKDASGNENHGRILGADWTSGVNGGSALEFDGTDDVVRIPNSESLDLTGDRFTLTAWIYPRNIRGDRDAAIISKAHEGASNEERYHLGIHATGRLDVRRYSGGQMARIRVGTVVEGEWQHIAAVYDGTHLIGYINGEEVGRARASGPLDPSTRDLLIGKRSDDRFFTGTIDDPRIYDRALSSSDIASLAVHNEVEDPEEDPETDEDPTEDPADEEGDEEDDEESDFEPQPDPDGVWDRVVQDTRVRGNLTVTEGEKWLIGPNVEVEGNVLVRGAGTVLGMRPGSSLRFLGGDPDRYVGGGMHYTSELDDDIGLWVWSGAALDISCTPKQGWNRTGSHSTWGSGDEYWIAPTDVGDFQPRRWSPGDRIPQVDPRVPAAEVVNVTRDCVIEGPGHIHIHSRVPQRIEYVQLRELGVSNSSEGQVLGRYALHMHHGGNGTAGTIVRGVAAIDSRGHVFVPHMSHGITFIDNVSVNSWGNGLFWDVGDPTNDLLVDRMAVLGVHRPRSLTGSDPRNEGFLLGTGENMEIRSSVAAGACCSELWQGFHWNPRDQAGLAKWTFREGNVAHNNSGHGHRFWTNTRQDHHVQNSINYRNGSGALEIGAYRNSVRYENLFSLDETLVQRANPVHLDSDDSGSPAQEHRNCHIEALDGPAVRTLHRNLSGDDTAYIKFIDCTLIPGNGHPTVLYSSGNNPWRAHFIRSGVTPDDFEFDVLENGTHILIDHEDGRKWEIVVEGGRKIVRSR